ncbi:hypothetical protein QOT17_022259 [Balamuthia mandrillaris]
MVAVAVLTNWDDWEEGYYPVIAGKIGGKWLEWFMTCGAVVASLGMFNSILYTSSAALSALGQEGMLGAPALLWTNRRKSPWVSILCNTVGVLVCLLLPFRELVQVDTTMYGLSVLLEYAALMWFRIKVLFLHCSFFLSYMLLLSSLNSFFFFLSFFICFTCSCVVLFLFLVLTFIAYKHRDRIYHDPIAFQWEP